MTDSSSAIQIDQISKTFKGGIGGNGVRALVDVSLGISHGDIFGLLGPNGAGKTTLVKILLGALHPTSGSASINGYEISDWRARNEIGFLPENHRFPSYQTGLQMLYCFGGLAGLSRSTIKSKAGGLLELVGMSQWADTKIKKYSKGMMQRLGLAQTLLNDPKIIFLDEPTDGVDPIGRHEIRNILLELKKQCKTIFLNSHLLSEVESVCDNVAILNKGHLVKTGPAKGLVTIKPTYVISTTELTPDKIEIIKGEYPGAAIDGNDITVSFDEESQVNNLLDLLRDKCINLAAVTPVKMSLEDSFIQLLKNEKENE